MPFSYELIHRIAAKHGLSGEPHLLDSTGMVNEAWQIGDEFIVRIAVQEGCDGEAAREAVVVPLVRAAGVRTPELIACSYEKDIVPAPYTIYEKSKGVLLGLLDIEPDGLTALYRELGHEIAFLHRMELTPELKAALALAEPSTPRRQLERNLELGKLDPETAGEIEAWLDFIEPKLGEPIPGVGHKDIHPWNLFVDPETYELVSIIDWGDASYGDVAIEFASMPLPAMPPMIEGYLEAGEELNEGFIPRVLHTGLALSLWENRNPDMVNYKRQWWRFPRGGWPELKAWMRRSYPELALRGNAIR